MHVCHLTIDGFRGIRRANIALPEHAVLLGANNVGKSAVVDALALLLGRDRLVRSLGDYDFFGGLPSPESRVAIKGVLTGFPSNEPEDFPEWFSLRTGTAPLWWNSDTGETTAEPGGDSHLCVVLGFAARFDRDTLEVETLRFFVEAETDPFEEPDLNTVSTQHLQAIGFFLLPSHRTWDRMLSFGSELFRRVLRVQEAIPGEAVTDLRDWIREPDPKLESAEQLAPVVERVNSELTRLFGPQNVSVTFRPTTGDISGVLQSIVPFIGARGGASLPIGRHGSGLVSMQTLTLLLELGRIRGERGQSFILAAEEPELHLHPGHHQRVIGRIRGATNQSLATTHSPEVAASYQPHEILILRNDDGALEANSLLAIGDPIPDKNALLRLFTLHRSDVCEALMHPLVVVPEGSVDFRWLRLLQRTCSAAAIAETAPLPRIGVLPTQDAQVVATYRKFWPSGPSFLPLVDGDTDGCRYRDELLALEHPPEHILQLANGADFETLIAWILSPEGDSDWRALDELLGGLAEQSVNALAVTLRTQKTRWDLQEELALMIAANPSSAKRAAAFLRSLAAIPAGDAVPDELVWAQDEGTSLPATQVWLLNLESS